MVIQQGVEDWSVDSLAVVPSGPGSRENKFIAHYEQRLTEVLVKGFRAAVTTSPPSLQAADVKFLEKSKCDSALARSTCHLLFHGGKVDDLCKHLTILLDPRDARTNLRVNCIPEHVSAKQRS